MNPDEIRAVYDLMPDDWEIARTSDLVRRSEEVERQRQHMQETIERWRNRALKAEAAVTRVERLAYASDDGSRYEHNGHAPHEGEPECPACWSEGIISALDAT
ncbi:hypothetical protein ICV35_25070 [Rhodococcus ruber]|uniref:hypothetical protein n=1 Tax=Rhodococcus ruber TaxID=1830 RepID=UPI001781966B|nr:hypothetical protein [Rhodococcus ruber]MBD8056922.1 hypothetical protein [Rhodococcus ruber]